MQKFLSQKIFALPSFQISNWGSNCLLSATIIKCSVGALHLNRPSNQAEFESRWLLSCFYTESQNHTFTRRRKNQESGITCECTIAGWPQTFESHFPGAFPGDKLWFLHPTTRRHTRSKFCSIWFPKNGYMSHFWSWRENSTWIESQQANSRCFSRCSRCLWSSCIDTYVSPGASNHQSVS